MKWHFEIFIRDLTEFTDGLADALYEAGCDDGTLASCNLSASITFTRAAPTLQSAIESAIANIKSTGLKPGKLVIHDLDHYAEAV